MGVKENRPAVLHFQLNMSQWRSLNSKLHVFFIVTLEIYVVLFIVLSVYLLFHLST